MNSANRSLREHSLSENCVTYSRRYVKLQLKTFL